MAAAKFEPLRRTKHHQRLNRGNQVVKRSALRHRLRKEKVTLAYAQPSSRSFHPTLHHRPTCSLEINRAGESKQRDAVLPVIGPYRDCCCRHRHRSLVLDNTHSPPAKFSIVTVLSPSRTHRRTVSPIPGSSLPTPWLRNGKGLSARRHLESMSTLLGPQPAPC